MDEKQEVSLWLSDFLLCDVLPDALEYISRICRSSGFETDCYTALDIQAAVELGISRNAVPSRCCTVRFRFLQCDADIHRFGTDYNGTFQAEKLVCLLPYGNNDTAYMQGKRQRIKECPSIFTSMGIFSLRAVLVSLHL